MATVPAGKLGDRLDGFRACEKCGSEDIYPGGVGDWRHTIVCEKCFHVRRGVPQAVIVGLVMEQWGLSKEDAISADAAAQAAYEAAIAKVSY